MQTQNSEHTILISLDHELPHWLKQQFGNEWLKSG